MKIIKNEKVLKLLQMPGLVRKKVLARKHINKYPGDNEFKFKEKSISVFKGEKIISVKATLKRKAHKRKIKISNDLNQITNKEKGIKEVVSTNNYKESLKNVDGYINKLKQTNEGKKILKAISNYTLGDYNIINEYMKSGNSKQFKEANGKDLLQNENLQSINQIETSINDIKKFISGAPKYQGNVYRGLQYKIDNIESKKRWNTLIKNIESSKEIKFKSFLSTSSEEMVGVNFATKQQHGKTKSLLIIIKCKSGVTIENISQIQSEHEILLDNDKTYKIIDFEKQDDKNHFLELEEI
jgi:hypothetical protein